MTDQSILLKQCSRKDKCVNPQGSWLPATTMYFYCHSRSRDQLTPACKFCTNADQAKYRADNPEKVREIKRKSAEKNREKTNERSRDKWHYDIEYREKHYARGLDWKRRHPNYKREEIKYKASTTLSNAIRLGKFPPAKAFTCVECGLPARHYHHHLGYELEHWFDVTPLCTKCHGKTWRRAQ